MHHSAVAVNEVHARSLAVRVVLQQAVVDIGKKTAESVDIQLQRGAFVDIAFAVDAHLALGLGQVVGHVVFQAVGAQHGVGAAQLGVAFDHGLHIGLASDAVAGHKDRHLRARGTRQRLAQHRAGAQCQRGRCRRGRHGRRPCGRGRFGHALRQQRQRQAAQQAGGQLGQHRARGGGNGGGGLRPAQGASGAGPYGRGR